MLRMELSKFVEIKCLFLKMGFVVIMLDWV